MGDGHDERLAAAWLAVAVAAKGDAVAACEALRATYGGKPPAARLAWRAVKAWRQVLARGEVDTAAAEARAAAAEALLLLLGGTLESRYYPGGERTVPVMRQPVDFSITYAIDAAKEPKYWNNYVAPPGLDAARTRALVRLSRVEDALEETCEDKDEYHRLRARGVVLGCCDTDGALNEGQRLLLEWGLETAAEADRKELLLRFRDTVAVTGNRKLTLPTAKVILPWMAEADREALVRAGAATTDSGDAVEWLQADKTAGAAALEGLAVRLSGGNLDGAVPPSPE